MCFSVNVNLVKDELEARYGAEFPDYDKYRPSYYYHAFGLPDLPAVCSGSPEKLRLLKWGLIPTWIKSKEEGDNIRNKTFNARAESIDTKRSFSASFSSKRCLIPVRGFYEWQHDGARKIPWYIYHFNDEIISLAGLYSEWKESTTGDLISTFTVITTDANELMSVIHNSKKRMPVILSWSEEKHWLDLSMPAGELNGLLKSCPSDMLKAHTISDLVNNRQADRNTPDVIKEFTRHKPGGLF